MFVGALVSKMSMACYAGTDCWPIGDMNRDWRDREMDGHRGDG